MVLINIEYTQMSKDELKKKLDELLLQIMDSAQYGDKAVIEEENSKLEITNLQESLRKTYSFIKDIYDSMDDTGQVIHKPKRMKRKILMDYGI